jgi:hypothetical protein
MKLTKTEKKIRIRTGKRVAYVENKLLPDWKWFRNLSAFLAELVRKVKRK